MLGAEGRPAQLPGVAVAPDEVAERLPILELWPAVKTFRGRIGPNHQRSDRGRNEHECQGDHESASHQTPPVTRHVASPRFSSNALSAARSFWLARRIARAMNGAISFEKPL